MFVIGATGNVGSATVQVLAAKYSGTVEIRAGVRNPDKAKKLESIAGVSVVKAEMGSVQLESTLKGVHSLYIVTPGAQNRAQLTVSTAEYAKKAGVKHQLIVSVLTADNQNTVFGRQCTQIETGIKALGVNYTFLRLPLFFENYFGFKDTIKSAGAIYNPVDSSKVYSPVAVPDVANASASILVSPEKHTNKTYNIISDRHSYNDVAAAFGEALGKTVTYNRVPYEAAKKAMMEMGYPEWQVDGGLELNKLIDAGDPVISMSNIGDYKQITGEEPTSLKSWVALVKAAFE